MHWSFDYASMDVCDPNSHLTCFAADSQRGEIISRACEECARKKIRCGMQRPRCSLCRRIGSECIYPTHRKRHVRRKAQLQTRGSHATKTAEESIAASEASSLVNSNAPDNGSSEQLIAARQSPIGINSPSLNQQQNQPESSQIVIPSQQEADRTAANDLLFGTLLTPRGSDNMFDMFLQSFPQSTDQYGLSTPDGSGSREPYDFRMNLGESLPNTSAFSNSSLEINNVLRRKFLAPVSESGGSAETITSAELQALFSIDLSTDVADHLLELYFDKIQPSLPLLHRPMVLASFTGTNLSNDLRYKDLDLDSALLLNGIFALAARFSERDDCWTCAPKIRGAQFMKKAQALRDLASREEGDDHLTLRYLQGCILLTYYQLSSRPSFQAWAGVGLCCRLAFALSIHQVDRESGSLNQDNQKSAEEWCHQEEQRRAWWIIFQMDNFASVIGGRPFGIDVKRADVWLPVSDEAWFNLRPIQSAFISSKGPASAWRSLLDCENQSAYAWYLVCNYLLRSAQEEFEARDRSVGSLKVLQSAIHCFLLSLPPNLRMCSKNLDFQEENFGEKNWIIANNFFIHCASTIVNLGFHAENLKHQDAETPRIALQGDGIGRITSVGSAAQQCGKSVRDQISVMRMWTPDYIPLASPFMAVAIVCAAATHVVSDAFVGSDPDDDLLSILDRQLLDLVVRRYSEYWELGSFCLDILQALKTSEPMGALKAKGYRSTWIRTVLQRVQLLKPV